MISPNLLYSPTNSSSGGKRLEDESTESYRKLLENFIHNNEDLERLEEITDKFNIFTSLNIIGNELRHSTFLSWLMDPNESHGLGDYFLQNFVKRVLFRSSGEAKAIPSIFEVDSWSFDDAEVRREWRNIDILVISEANHFVCAIENKIFSGEHSGQLKRYKEIIQKEFPNHKQLFVFLSVGDTDPSDEDYIHVTYQDVLDMITTLLGRKREKVSREIVTFIEHYTEMLRRYIMGDEEIERICQRIYKNHKRALELIDRHKPDIQNEIYDLLVKMINSDPNLISDDTNKRYIRFTSKKLDAVVPRKGSKWTVNIDRILLFEIQNRLDEVRIYLVIGPGDSTVREKLHGHAQTNMSLFKNSKRSLGKSWSTIYTKTIYKFKTNEDYDWEDILNKVKSNFQDFIERELPKIEVEIEKLGGQFDEVNA